MKTSRILIAMGALAIAIAPAASAMAAQHGHIGVARGWRGGAYSARHVDRTSTGMSESRNIQTTGGRGLHQTRNATYGDGAYQSTRQTQFDNGKTMSRSISAQNNGDGTASYTRTVTNPDGVSHSNTREVPYPQP